MGKAKQIRLHCVAKVLFCFTGHNQIAMVLPLRAVGQPKSFGKLSTHQALNPIQYKLAMDVEAEAEFYEDANGGINAKNSAALFTCPLPAH